MKIVVYYGGRGLLDDPTLYVLKKMEDVLRELRVSIERYNIYEHKNEIATLPQTFKEADGIILATTIELLGIGVSPLVLWHEVSGWRFPSRIRVQIRLHL